MPPDMKLDVSKLLESNDMVNLINPSGDLDNTKTASIVCINSIPVLNFCDLTRRSHNMRAIRQGKVTNPQDLERDVRPDEKIKESDLAKIEREANKKKRKRIKAQMNGEMISPLATSRPNSSAQGSNGNNNQAQNNRNNPFDLGNNNNNNNDDDGDDMMGDDDPEQQQAIRDQIMVD